MYACSLWFSLIFFSLLTHFFVYVLSSCCLLQKRYKHVFVIYASYSLFVLYACLSCTGDILVCACCFCWFALRAHYACLAVILSVLASSVFFKAIYSLFFSLCYLDITSHAFFYLTHSTISLLSLFEFCFVYTFVVSTFTCLIPVSWFVFVVFCFLRLAPVA